jgi:putative transcriptional regulator
MTNHPNRSKLTPSPGRNPRPDEVRRARLAAGLTQTAAAAVVYCTLGTWQRWESGERAMHPAFWDLWRRKIAEARESARAVAFHDPRVIALRAWLDARVSSYQAAPVTDAQMASWLADAEQRQGVVEIRAADSVSGHPETFHVGL